MDRATPNFKGGIGCHIIAQADVPSEGFPRERLRAGSVTRVTLD